MLFIFEALLSLAFAFISLSFAGLMFSPQFRLISFSAAGFADISGRRRQPPFASHFLHDAFIADAPPRDAFQYFFSAFCSILSFD